ncbi:hypothetical protein AXF42_Ash013215 [Apostasia shenzhenica]|uniref:Uncharacterized protein n=1 Tax=Apostasia shenzhenica TaxID=1088818 RepID=A0A2I0BBB5_9ASPA|nr:hypothetical protein AXF42_Ash013215 [Apostasia shenzhenica]
MSVPAATTLGEEEVPVAKVAGVLTQVLESVQKAVDAAAAEVVIVSDSPVKPSQKARELKEVALVGETATGEKLAPGKILLKEEEIERLFPRFVVFEGGVRKLPLVVCRPPPLGVPLPAPEKKRRPFLSLPPLGPLSEEKKEEKGKKGEQEEGNKMEEVAKGKDDPLSTIFVSAPGIEGPGDKMEEATKEKGVVLPAAPSATFGTEGVWSMLGDRLCEIRWAEEKILGNTSEVLEVIKSLKGKEDVEARCLRE